MNFMKAIHYLLLVTLTLNPVGYALAMPGVPRGGEVGDEEVYETGGEEGITKKAPSRLSVDVEMIDSRTPEGTPPGGRSQANSPIGFPPPYEFSPGESHLPGNLNDEQKGNSYDLASAAQEEQTVQLFQEFMQIGQKQAGWNQPGLNDRNAIRNFLRNSPQISRANLNATLLILKEWMDGGHNLNILAQKLQSDPANPILKELYTILETRGDMAAQNRKAIARQNHSPDIENGGGGGFQCMDTPVDSNSIGQLCQISLGGAGVGTIVFIVAIIIEAIVYHYLGEFCPPNYHFVPNYAYDTCISYCNSYYRSSCYCAGPDRWCENNDSGDLREPSESYPNHDYGVTVGWTAVATYGLFVGLPLLAATCGVAADAVSNCVSGIGYCGANICGTTARCFKGIGRGIKNGALSIYSGATNRCIRRPKINKAKARLNSLVGVENFGNVVEAACPSQ